MDKVYFSNAKWTKIDDSMDRHESLDFAQHICSELKKRYGQHTKGCDIRGFCIETWVTDENGNKIEE